MNWGTLEEMASISLEIIFYVSLFLFCYESASPVHAYISVSAVLDVKDIRKW